MALAAAAAFIAAAVVSVFAAAFALYALLQASLTSAGAAAVVAAVFGLIAVLAGFLATRKSEGRRQDQADRGQIDPAAGLLDLALGMARQKPVLTAGAAIAAGLIALRNPQLVGVVVRAFMDGKSPPKS